VTNGLAQNDTSVAQQGCNWQWKVEQCHREAKQRKGLQRCQCRLARIVLNHIGCAPLVWLRLWGRGSWRIRPGEPFIRSNTGCSGSICGNNWNLPLFAWSLR